MRDFLALYIFLIKTSDYAQSKASKEINSLSTPEYIRSCLKYLEEENIRKVDYINPTFHKKIDEANFLHLIENNAKTLAKMDTGIRYMFNNKKIYELKEAYKLIINSPESLKNITDELDPFIRERGDELYNNKEIARDPISINI
jgi:hypothetical protein